MAVPYFEMVVLVMSHIESVIETEKKMGYLDTSTCFLMHFGIYM